MLRSPGKSIAEFIVKVSSADFPVQNIQFSEEKKEKIGSEKNKREKALISAALQEPSGTKAWQTPFRMPAPGRISSVFGAMRKLDGKVLWVHKGIDIAGGMGTPVHPSAQGRVILADSDFNLNGKTVMIDHGAGVKTTYVHLDTITVEQGQSVLPEEMIGTIGSTGLTTGPNLHWGLFINSIVVDPQRWIERDIRRHGPSDKN